LSKEGNAAYDAIVGFLRKHDLTYTGGCKAFYSPEEWKARGEEYGDKSHLVICHDGGDLSSICGGDYGPMHEKFDEVLKACGVYLEPCTCWYTAVYS